MSYLQAAFASAPSKVFSSFFCGWWDIFSIDISCCSHELCNHIFNFSSLSLQIITGCFELSHGVTLWRLFWRLGKRTKMLHKDSRWTIMLILYMHAHVGFYFCDVSAVSSRMDRYFGAMIGPFTRQYAASGSDSKPIMLVRVLAMNVRKSLSQQW